MRTVLVDHGQRIARATFALGHPTLVTEIRLGRLPDGQPAVPRLRILIDGHLAAESYWQTSSQPECSNGCRYVYPGEAGATPLLFQAGQIEFRVQARERQEAQVPLTEDVQPGWIYEHSADGGMTWQPLPAALPISLRIL